jgi:hypothetical protein
MAKSQAQCKCRVAREGWAWSARRFFAADPVGAFWQGTRSATANRPLSSADLMAGVKLPSAFDVVLPLASSKSNRRHTCACC